MNASPGLSKIEQLRARDGDACWLCGGKLDFAAPPGSRKAPSREHLHPVSLGGGSELSNLVLCHPGCNRHLGCKPLDEKLKIRAKWQASRGKTGKAKTSPVEARAPKGARVVAREAVPDLVPRSALVRWQVATAIAAGSGLLAIGFAAGVIVGG